MTNVRVIATKFQVEYVRKFRGKGKFPAVAQQITGTGCTSLPVYLQYRVD